MVVTGMVERLWLEGEVAGAEEARVEYLRIINELNEKGVKLTGVYPEEMLEFAYLMHLDSQAELSPREMMHSTVNGQVALDVLKGRLATARLSPAQAGALSWDIAFKLMNHPIGVGEVDPIREKRYAQTQQWLVGIGFEALAGFFDR